MPASKAVVVIRNGLPPRSVDQVAKTLAMKPSELARILGISPRTLRDQASRATRLSRENTEKLVRAARVHALARRVFSTDDAANRWLAAPALALDGFAPFDLLDTDVGAREVELVLHGIAHGNIL
jgi:putative toxin-antitoxin system antitoxin component (TIGR02293 family)